MANDFHLNGAIKAFQYLAFGWLLICCLTARIAAQDFVPVYDGVEYSAVEYSISGEPVKIYLLRLDPSKVRLDVVHAMDSAIGLERTSSLARRYGAIAAINGGFFRNDESIWAGDAAGVLMIDGRLMSESNNSRIALFLDNSGPQTKLKFAASDIGHCFKTAGRIFTFTGINRERKSDDIIEYTPEFGRTTLTAGRGLEVIVRRERITDIVEERGSNLIPPDGFIISATGKYVDEIRPVIRIGNKIERHVCPGKSDERNMSIHRNPKSNSNLLQPEDITNGVSELLRDGKIHLTWKEEKAAKTFAENRHPRTAIAKFPDGKILLVAVDGRRPKISVGMTLQELAEFLRSLGAVDGINLDGGGSTTMFLDGRVVNNPSDAGGERRVGDAIIVTRRISWKQTQKLLPTNNNFLRRKSAQME